MAGLGYEALPVGEDNRLIGMITGCEITAQVVAEGRDPEKIIVRQAMSSDVLYCFEDESAEECLGEDGSLVGPPPSRGELG